MKIKGIVTLSIGLMLSHSSFADTLTVGPSGKTYASNAVQCAANPVGDQAATVEAGLFNPKRGATATISLNGIKVAQVDTNHPSSNIWLEDGNNTVVVALSRKTADTYSFNVQAGICTPPDTSGNTFSSDGTLEYAASGKSYATVTPGCALNGLTGRLQPYVNLIDNGNYLLNVSINGIPLTQLSATRPHTPVFLTAGQNVISAANGTLSTDYYLRDGGDGTCVLP